MQWLANQVADALAGRAAQEAGLHPLQVEQVLRQASTAHLILNRLVRVALLSKVSAAGGRLATGVSPVVKPNSRKSKNGLGLPAMHSQQLVEVRAAN